jgi:hypothetical protein
VTPASGGIFQAVLATTSLPVGTDNITVTYSGDANYIGSSTSGTVTVVSGPVVTVSSTGSTLTSSASSQSTLTFSETSYGGWTGVIGFTCDSSTLPANASCVFSPGQMTVQASTSAASYNTQTTQLTITIDNPSQTPSASSMIWWMGAASGLLLFFVRRRYLRGAWSQVTLLIAGLLLAASATGLTACSSTAANLTPTGTSTVTVYANADPYQSGSTTATQSCGTATVGGVTTASPALTPCSQQSFKVSLTVQ